MHMPQRIHSAWLGVLVMSTSILQALRTGAAGYALVGVHPHLEKRYRFMQRIKRAQRAEPLAEWAVKHHAATRPPAGYSCFQVNSLPSAARMPALVSGEGNRALQHTLRAEILAEERIAHAHLIDNKRRQQHHHDQQHRIFQISQRLQTLGGALGRWDLVQKLLKPAKRAEKAADKPSQQHPE